jgi:hypothetical protein
MTTVSRVRKQVYAAKSDSREAKTNVKLIAGSGSVSGLGKLVVFPTTPYDRL